MDKWKIQEKLPILDRKLKRPSDKKFSSRIFKQDLPEVFI